MLKIHLKLFSLKIYVIRNCNNVQNRHLPDDNWYSSGTHILTAFDGICFPTLSML